MIPGKEIDQDALKHYNINLKKSSQKPKINTNKLIMKLVVLFGLFNVIGAQELNQNYRHCQSKEINRIVNYYPECVHPKTLTKKLTRHGMLNNGKFPSGVFMLIKINIT